MLTLHPAAGRDYHSRDAAIAAWRQGHTFLTPENKPLCVLSTPELCSQGHLWISIRFCCMSQVAVYRLECPLDNTFPT